MGKLNITPLCKTMGAEITGVNLSKTIDEKTKNYILKALSDHLIICIRNQDLNPKQLVAVTKMFGTPKKYFVTDETYEDVPEVIVVTNRSKLNENEPKVYASHWHTDDSYMKEPATLTFIYPEILPKNGGGTDFINCYKVLEELPQNLKNKVYKLKAIHKHLSRRNVSEVSNLSDNQKKLTPDVVHPFVRTHPLSKKQSLYINPNRIDHIQGYNNNESDILLDELYEFSFQKKFQYSHNYQKGDLVIWDNRCTMHKANSEYNINELRVMHRVMLEGEKVF